MVNSVTASYVVSDFILLATGALLIAAGVIWEKELSTEPTTESVARFLLLKNAPLMAVIANGALIIAAFLISLPSFALPTSRGWLKAHGWLVMVCALFTLVLGLSEWLQTLTTRANLETIWGQQNNVTQSILQQKFDCCGYMNSTSPMYVRDSVCTSDLVAASKEGCVSAFSSYSERWLGLLFTAAFGVVGMDAVVMLCAGMLIKYRKEQLRYRLIDQKWGVGNI
ncbi:uncharacterized protein LAJ45_02422 [Morchella importuna]|uniref:Tetraspanin n=1 Tax=Morchella conica CCBAS932 TaxID=1392247 RepID=A0A3N4KZ68_9PEZI|nr:uncharacterized protein H6S33_005779 [Morchella sextelata]XP_045974913.1 uncharacterized protein LAJ45_02422 [Morchella importuna]KAH0613893.1 hypothetical protein H6S33_005779 [Morchella sextelata]KAH8153609.1 hypothetical protein LAJ45_02422 [Morchella importuna]RPB14768.1 hypothetical protein P167DRAFT_483866 [Morchella conica CCBAS932]